MGQLEDDFNYIQSVLDKMNRFDMVNEVDIIINYIGTQYQDNISGIADQLIVRGE